MRYYKVIMNGGHVGSGNDVPLTFFIKAKDMNSAIKHARNMPAVKHNKPGALMSAKEISEEEYKQYRENYSAYDIYR